MIAATYTPGPGIEVASVEDSDPRPGEVQIAVAYTGICGTDLHISHGAMDERVEPGAAIGHEMSGRVAAIGEGVTGVEIGSPVTVMPLKWCGECATCRRGHQHICEKLEFVGIDSPGSLQQRWNVPADLIIPLPADMSLRTAALVEPVAVAYHDVARGAVAQGDRVLVVGGGPVGVLIALVAAQRGADVCVVELDAYRRDLAAQFGFAVIDPAAGDAADDPWFADGGADVAFEVSGSQPGLTAALACLRPRGRMVAVGIHPQPREVDLKGIFWRELEILGARVYERADFEGAVELIASGAIPADELISEVFPLSETRAAFDRLESGGAVMKVLVDCGGEAAS